MTVHTGAAGSAFGCVAVMALLFFCVVPADARAEAAAADAGLLKTWCDALIGLQIREPSRPELKGGILCPACGLLHGRICDVFEPFVHLYATTGEKHYLDAALSALDWCEANMLLPDGLFRNDRQTTWRSTTAFFAISLHKALKAYGDALPASVRQRMQALFLRSALAAHELYEQREGPFKPVTNYLCIYPELMFLLSQETGDAKYREVARRAADDLRTTLFDAEGFLVGEGFVHGRREGRTARGCAMVDLGYNLEESLTALVEYADLAGDAALRKAAVESAKVQLAFVLPDGAIDDSCGSRSVKWTYYGSRTSDGILSLLTLLQRDVPYAAEMARRVVKLYGRCTGADGLLAGGVMYAEAGEPACVHHAFARAKTLAAYLRSGLAKDPSSAPLPREAAQGVRHFAAMDADLVAFGPWRATLSANDAFNVKRSAAVSGGTLSLLWHAVVGPVSVATLGEYFYPERTNMQDDRHEMNMQCLAPRIVAGKRSNIFDYESVVTRTAAGDLFSAEIKGLLTDADGGKGATYRLAYTFDADGVRLEVESSDPTARFVWPLVAAPADAVRVEGNRVTVERPGGNVVLTASAPLTMAAACRKDRIWSPVAGFLCAPVSVSVAQPVSLALRFERK